MQVREKKLEQRFREHMERLGGKALKFTSPCNDGVPDRLVILPDGRIIMVELKTETGKLSAIQAWQHKQLRELGVKVVTVYGDRGVSDFMDEVRQRYRNTPFDIEQRKKYPLQNIDFYNTYGKQNRKDRYEEGGDAR